MEDTLYYIGLGLIIVFSLVRKVGKVASSKSKEHIDIPTEDIQPIKTLFEELERRTAVENLPKATPAKSPQRPESIGKAQSLETIIDEEDIYMQEKAKTTKKAQKSASVKTKKSTHSTPKEPAQLQKTAKKDENGSISKEFDLREAVIYSEILKPKFEEE